MLSKDQWIKVGKGLLIAVAGAALTAAEEYVTGADFGDLTGFVVAANSVIVNILRKLIPAKGDNQ